jgi:hypothetical protein
MARTASGAPAFAFAADGLRRQMGSANELCASFADLLGLCFPNSAATLLAKVFADSAAVLVTQTVA